MKHVTSKYADVALAKALRTALKVSEADPGRAGIVRQRANDIVQHRGVRFSIGGGGLLPMSAQPLNPDAELRQRHLDAAHWILASALAMGTMAADYRKALAACARFFDTGRPRRPPLTPKDRPLTLRQAEVVQAVGECKGNLAEAARRLGIDRKSLKECYDAGMKKLARAGRPKPKTVRLSVDRRGQEKVAEDRRR